MDTQRVKKSSRLKGSVLYTVTLVMMVMLILMMSAIALAGTANKRAYGEYHNDQTTYTGRSIIESVVGTLDRGQPNEAIGSYITNQLAVDHSKTVVVNVNNKEALPGGFGTVEKLEFKYAGKDEEGGFYVSGSGFDIIKVTATVKMGNEITTYSQYMSANDATDSPPSGGAGFLAAGGLKLSGSTASAFHGPSYTETLPLSLSPLTWPDPFEQDLVEFRNPVHISGGGLYGATTAFTASNARVSFAQNISGSNGLTVMGNFALMNEIHLLSEFEPSAASSITNIPYIYVGGTFYTANKLNVGNLTNQNPINIYSGRVVFTKNESFISSSIYCYNSDPTYDATVPQGPLSVTLPDLTLTPVDGGSMGLSGNTTEINNKLDGTSSISVLGFASDSSNLIDWAETNASIGNPSLHGGSFYTKGSLKLGINVPDPYNPGATTALTHVNIAGSVYVDQILDMTDIWASQSSINGDIYVNGQLIVRSAADFNVFLGKNESTMVKCNSITDISGNPLSAEDFPSSRVTITSSAFSWPTGMDKDEILGKGSNPSYKIVSTHDDAFEKFYDAANGKYKRSINESSLEVDAGSKIYYYDGTNNEVKMRTVSDPAVTACGRTIEISEGCTLAGGTFQGCTFEITPTTEDKLWINLYDVSFQNCRFIVDDSKNKEVYFYIPQGDNYSTFHSPVEDAYFSAISGIVGSTITSATTDNTFVADDTWFITKNYHDTYFGEDGSLKRDLDLKTYYKSGEDKNTENVAGKNLVPDLYICQADNRTESEIVFLNSCALTGHLITLNSQLTWHQSKLHHDGSNFSYTVVGATQPDKMANNNISAIGSIFVKGATQLQNDFEFYYVDYLGEAEDAGERTEGFLCHPIPGYITY